jgi:hypothetical protein
MNAAQCAVDSYAATTGELPVLGCGRQVAPALIDTAAFVGRSSCWLNSGRRINVPKDQFAAMQLANFGAWKPQSDDYMAICNRSTRN